MASLFDIGKSGLQSYRQALSVTGQNIANVNTEGYKRREADLKEVSGGQGDIYGVSRSSGLGVRMSAICLLKWGRALWPCSVVRR